MLSPELRELVRHMEWADAVVWGSVLASDRARTDPQLRERLYHVHGVQRAYLLIWRGEAPDIPEPTAFEDLSAIRDWAREYHREAAAYLEGLESEALEQHVEFPWAERIVERWGSPRPATLAETVFQVVSHSTYHRGQVNMRLRELEDEPPLTDFIAWIWMGRPAPDWGEPPR